MHAFLRAIGFSSITSEYEVELLLDEVYKNYERREAVKDEDGKRAFLEMSKTVGPEIGIRLCGELDQHGFHRQYYFPYLIGSGETTREDISLERRASGHSFVGVCDDGRVGCSLIFYLQNPAELMKESLRYQLRESRISTTFTGLSLGGRILLPIKENESLKDERRDYFVNRTSLVSAAKNGSQEAIESLTLEDMDIYSMLSRRALREDVFSIVDTFFMPYGMECDQYQIMGIINFYTKVYNSYTRETLYQMNIECNGMHFDICINKNDLLGDPEIGRRFKGSIWLQGRLNFPK